MSLFNSYWEKGYILRPAFFDWSAKNYPGNISFESPLKSMKFASKPIKSEVSKFNLFSIATKKGHAVKYFDGFQNFIFH